MLASFWVPGIPQPGGSKKGFVNPKTGRVVIVEDAKRNKDWRTSVQHFALEAFRQPPISDAPLRLEVEFVFPRPQGHYGSGKNSGRVRESAPRFPAKKPDLTKIVRSTEDALTGIVWADDALVVEQVVRKRYGPVPGAQILVSVMEGGA